jgi:hypothetical protein
MQAGSSLFRDHFLCNGRWFRSRSRRRGGIYGFLIIAMACPARHPAAACDWRRTIGPNLDNLKFKTKLPAAII